MRIVGALNTLWFWYRDVPKPNNGVQKTQMERISGFGTGDKKLIRMEQGTMQRNIQKIHPT